jgi:sorting nexin-25
MEYQDRRRRSLPVQFWLLIESLKDPLEDVDSSSDDDMTDRVRRPDIATVTTTLSDIKMVWDVYFATSNELESNRRYIRTIKDFVETEEVSSITSGKIRRVRRAIFAAQADVLEGMEEEDYPGFVKTELYFKAVSALSLQQQPGPISSDTGAPNFSLPETRARSPSLEIIPTPPVRSAAQFPFSLSRATSPRPSPSSTSLPSLAIRVDHPPSRDHENKSLLSPRFVSDPIVASPAMVRTISTGSIELGLGIVVPPNKRRPINPLSNSLEFLMASTSPVTSSKVEKKEKRVPLFEEPLFGEDDDDTNGKEESGEEEFGRKQDERVELSDDEYVQVKSIEAIQDALSSILASDARMASSHTTATLPSRSASPGVTTRSFTDIQRSRTNKPMTSVLTASTTSTTATLDSTKDVKFGKNKRVIFDDGEEFDEEEEFASKVDTEFDLDILVAAPGDLHLPLEIANIAERIDKLEHQESVVAALIRKAILTGVASELKILGKSQDSLKREVRTLTFQKAQYESQESENKLVPGRTNVSISGTTVGQANNQSFQLYLVELHQLAADGTFTSGWIVTRRYSEFATLHGKLKEKYNTAAKAIDLPGKSIVDRYTDNFIKQRKLGLEKYLKVGVSLCLGRRRLNH